jgi:hypothetical protein
MTLAAVIIFAFNLRYFVTYPASLVFVYLSNGRLFSSIDVLEPVLARWQRTLAMAVIETFRPGDPDQSDDKTGFLRDISVRELISASIIILIFIGTFVIYRYYTGESLWVAAIIIWIIAIMFNFLWKPWYLTIQILTFTLWTLMGLLVVLYALTIRSALYIWRIVEMAIGLRRYASVSEASVNFEWIMFKGGYAEIGHSFSSSNPGDTANFLVNSNRGVSILAQVVTFYAVLTLLLIAIK